LEFGVLVLAGIIAFDVVLMVFVVRLVVSEPPRKHPKTHPLVLEYAAHSGTAAAPEVLEDETLPVAEADESAAASEQDA
jgi:hypothetical protein